jgi:Tfp pilus assembly protein PilO
VIENAFKLEYGVAGVCVLLTIMVVFQAFKFVWALREKKDNLSEKTIKELVIAVQKLEQTVADLPKFRTDIRRFYAAIKHVSGDRWPTIRDEIMKDDLIT